MASKYQEKLIRKFESEGFEVLKIVKLSKDGFPDLLLLGEGGEARFVEVKEEKDTLKELQKYRIDELNKKGFIAYCLKDKKGVIYGNSGGEEIS